MDVQVGLAHFAGNLRSLGGGRLRIAVGGLTVGFEGLSEPIVAMASKRYEPFLSAADPIHTVLLREGLPHYLDIPPDGFLRLEEQTFPEGRILTSHDFAAFRPLGNSPGVLRVQGGPEPKAAVSAMENYLRWTVADLALSRGGFVMHSAGLVRGGRAYLFYGHSGAGKSTVTELSAGAPVLSDDLVLVLNRDGTFLAATTPFHGTLGQRVKEQGLYPVQGLFRLRQAPVVQLRPLSPAVAVASVLSCCPFVQDPAVRMGTLQPLVESLCQSVPVQELLFRKDASFWDIIGTGEQA